MRFIGCPYRSITNDKQAILLYSIFYIKNVINLQGLGFLYDRLSYVSTSPIYIGQQSLRAVACIEERQPHSKDQIGPPLRCWERRTRLPPCLFIRDHPLYLLLIQFICIWKSCTGSHNGKRGWHQPGLGPLTQGPLSDHIDCLYWMYTDQIQKYFIYKIQQWRICGSFWRLPYTTLI